MTTQDTGFDASPCQQYAYRFWHRFDSDLPTLGFILLHPPLGEWLTDRAFVSCVHRARKLRYGKVEVAFLFPRRAFVLGPDTFHGVAARERDRATSAVLDMFDRCSKVVAAWGSHPAAPERADDVIRVIQTVGYGNSLWHSGFNKDGSPKNPLQVSIGARAQRWVL